HPRLSTRSHPPSLHDALPIFSISTANVTDPIIFTAVDANRETAREIFRLDHPSESHVQLIANQPHFFTHTARTGRQGKSTVAARSEEHTSELQSRENLVCRLL